jgi:hypothetical protein
MRDARRTKSEKEKEALIDLAHTWAQAAFRCGPVTATVSAAPKPTRSHRTFRRYGRMITRLLFEPSRAPTS